MENQEFKKVAVFSVAAAIEYVPNSIATKVISRISTGNVTAVAFDTGEILVTKIVPFDTLVQAIEGKAEMLIGESPLAVKAGQSVIVPAHSTNIIWANGRFKMQSTIIKSGYED